MEENNNKDRKNNRDNDGENEEGIIEPIGGLWTEIIKDSEIKHDDQSPFLFICGDKNTGKKSLLIEMMNLSRLNIEKIDDLPNQYGLMNYINLIGTKYLDNDEKTYREINTYILRSYEENQFFPKLIKLEDLLNSIFLIVVDVSRPWDILESLDKWIKYIQKNIETLKKKEKDFLIKEKFKEKSELCKYKKLINIIYSFKRNKVI